MIKTTWGNSLVQVGFVWRHEGRDRREHHQWDIAALKSSLRRSSRERGGRRRGEGRGTRLSGAREGVVGSRCDGRKEEEEWRIGGDRVAQFEGNREIAPVSGEGSYKGLVDLAEKDHPQSEHSILSFPFPLTVLFPLSPPAPISLPVHPRSPASPCVASHLYNTLTRHISLCLLYYPRFVPSSAHNKKDSIITAVTASTLLFPVHLLVDIFTTTLPQSHNPHLQWKVPSSKFLSTPRAPTLSTLQPLASPTTPSPASIISSTPTPKRLACPPSTVRN
jgi:hypothetical protein